MMGTETLTTTLDHSIVHQTAQFIYTEIERCGRQRQIIHPRFKEGEIFDPVENQVLVENEVNARDNHRTAQRS
jgi:hypothetical protein